MLTLSVRISLTGEANHPRLDYNINLNFES